MNFFSHMVNAWSLAWDALNGTMDEVYPIIDTSVGAGNTAYENDGLDYENDYYDQYMANVDREYLADVDDQRAHHFTNANSSYNDGWTRQFHQEQLKELDNKNMAHYFKYHEEEILKDIEEYVSQTYKGHYTGKSHEFRNVQTIDLMASKELAAGFCQANILKYGSRYGNKDGKNKKDLMKVIHYAMLLLHFDNHLYSLVNHLLRTNSFLQGVENQRQ